MIYQDESNEEQIKSPEMYGNYEEYLDSFITQKDIDYLENIDMA